MDLQTVLTGKSQGGERVTDLLREDHRKIRELSEQYRTAIEQQSEARQSIAEEICMQLELHAQVEEEIVYPAASSVNHDLVSQAIEDHLEMQRDIEHIEQLTLKDSRYDHIVLRIVEAAARHIEQEEASLFPLIEQRLAHMLPELRKQAIRRKEQLAGSTQEMEGRS